MAQQIATVSVDVGRVAVVGGAIIAVASGIGVVGGAIATAAAAVAAVA